MIVDPTSSSAVTGAIRQAARATGTDFKYLLATAQVESNLNPNAQVSTSSAKGLFQFIEQTWLMTMKEQGQSLGYAPYANAITRSANGQYVVGDQRMYERIMSLRTDPGANALMAGAFTRANTAKLAERLGRAPTEGELYVAHFLGSSGAGRLISLADSAPGTAAAPMFPGPARANPSVFYDGRRARSVSEVYHVLVTRYDAARGSPPSTPTMVAGAAATSAAVPSADPAPALRGKTAPKPEPEAAPVVQAAMPAVQDTAQVVQAYAAAAQQPARQVEARQAFYGLFRTGATDEPVAPMVSALWTAPLPVTDEKPAPLASSSGKAKAVTKPTPLPEPAAAPPTPAASDQGAMSLFQDLVPNARALFRGRV